MSADGKYYERAPFKRCTRCGERSRNFPMTSRVLRVWSSWCRKCLAYNARRWRARRKEAEDKG